MDARLSMRFVALALVALPLTPRSADAQERIRLAPVPGLDEYFAIPGDNPLTATKIELGRRLFFDVGLSRDRSLSCASCHRPDFAFADTVARSRGTGGRAGRRNTPAIVNRAYGSSFFWDGRASSLEAQVLQPVGDRLELDLPVGQLIARLRADTSFQQMFGAAFAGVVTATNVARALASYLRTIRSGDSPFDRHRRGDTAALSETARRGAALFFGPANCATCHVGPNFTDEGFHNTGIAVGKADQGRHAVTRRAADRGRFKTPTLRDVARTAPYMHDGSLTTLDAVIDFYDGGGRVNANLDAEIRPLRLDAVGRADLVAFLRSLTSVGITCAPVVCRPSGA